MTAGGKKMRLERLNHNKIKIFLTLDDLSDRGLTKEDLWNNSLKVHQLFREMINEASEELDFHANGSIAVEVYSLKAQGMVIIVSKNNDEELEDEFLDDYIEMQVKVDEHQDILYEFLNFEDVLDLAKVLQRFEITEGALYSYQGRYYLLFDDISKIETEHLVAILAEYGTPTHMTTHRLHEYGKLLIKDHAVRLLNDYFS